MLHIAASFVHCKHVTWILDLWCFCHSSRQEPANLKPLKCSGNRILTSVLNIRWWLHSSWNKCFERALSGTQSCPMRLPPGASFAPMAEKDRLLCAVKGCCTYFCENWNRKFIFRRPSMIATLLEQQAEVVHRMPMAGRQRHVGKSIYTGLTSM